MFRPSRAVVAAALLGAVIFAAPGHVLAQDSQQVRVIVDNQGYYDMHVYALGGGTRRSLGLATGLSRREFTLPQVLVDSRRDVQILADPVGGRNGYVSQALFVDPGDWITVVIRSNQNLSYTFVSEYEPDPEPEEAPPDSATEKD